MGEAGSLARPPTNKQVEVVQSFGKLTAKGHAAAITRRNCVALRRDLLEAWKGRYSSAEVPPCDSARTGFPHLHIPFPPLVKMSQSS